MKLEKLFIIFCIIALVMGAILLILNILRPEKEYIVINQMNIKQELIGPNARSPQLNRETSLEQKALLSNQKFFELEQKREEDTRILNKKTKNWHGNVDGIEYDGRDERIFGSENFYLYGTTDD